MPFSSYQRKVVREFAATPLGKHAQEIYKAFDAAGHGGVDFSGIIQHVRGLAGK